MCLSLRVSQEDESTREKEVTSWLCVRSLFPTWLDLMLILDSNSRFRNLLNLDIHNFTLVPHKLSPYKVDYPWVMTPLGNDLG